MFVVDSREFKAGTILEIKNNLDNNYYGKVNDTMNAVSYTYIIGEMLPGFVRV